MPASRKSAASPTPPDFKYPKPDRAFTDAMELHEGAVEVFGFLPGFDMPRRSSRIARVADVGQTRLGSARVVFGDSLRHCPDWPAPTVIVSDGPYGLHSYPGDPWSPNDLADFYEPHLRLWHNLALPCCTLWFWNSEQGWANCHRIIEECGWEFRNCHIWDKGIAHVAGNVNTRTIRKYPVVTEVCVQYVRRNTLPSGGANLSLRDWLRAEWARTGLRFSQTNDACGVKDAATRKYFTRDHLWYFPPSEAFVRIADFANAHGRPDGRPYFAKPDGSPFTAVEWEGMRAKFHCEIGVGNVWHEPAVRGGERLKNGTAALHMNQKPVSILEQTIRSTSDQGDVVWEPFGGLCSASIAALRTGRHAYAAEINPEYFLAATRRIHDEEPNLISGRPRIYTPFIVGAKYAAQYRNHYWKHLRGSSDNTDIVIPEAAAPYPKKSDKTADKPVMDGGKNFGRIARSGIMDEYLSLMAVQPVCGIKAIHWLEFFKIFHQDVTDEEIRASFDRLRAKAGEIASSSLRESVLVLLSDIEAHLAQLA